MGADFLFAACKLPVDQDGETVFDYDKIKAQVSARVAAIPASDISEVIENMTGEAPASDQEAVDYFLEAIQTVLHLQGSREICICKFESDREWIITGGMSWGDEPTDAYDPISAVDNLGVFNEPFMVTP